MAHIRTKKELYERDLTPAEEQLIEACKNSDFCKLGVGELPPKGTPDPSRHIHADVLRYLIRGGCDDYKVDDIGVWVEGAHVTGTLDLDFTTARGAIRMHNSRFEERIDCEQTKCRQLELSGSNLQGLRGQSMKVTGSVFLEGTTTNATIDLISATIGGQLDCEKATFKVKEDTALNVQGANITADVFLMQITTNATIALNSATIGGQLGCVEATFEVKKGDALFAQNTKMNGGLIWLGVTVAKGTFSFSNAYTSSLTDDKDSWPSGGQVDLNGMTYDTIIGGPLDAKTRLAWLDKGSNWNGEFKPQPYTQLAKVLRDMGHDKDARLVLEKREELLRQSERKRFRAPPNPTDRNYMTALGYDVLSLLHWAIVEKAFKHLIGFGHRPFKSLGWLFALWGIAVWLSHETWDGGDFAPTSAVLQSSEEWQDVAKRDDINPAEEWSIRKTLPNGTKTYAAGQDWSTFSSFAYAADLVIPIINLGQTDTWGPSTERGPWGKRLWRYGFMLQIAGWIVTALGAAAITGLIRRD